MRDDWLDRRRYWRLFLGLYIMGEEDRERDGYFKVWRRERSIMAAGWLVGRARKFNFTLLRKSHKRPTFRSRTIVSASTLSKMEFIR